MKLKRLFCVAAVCIGTMSAFSAFALPTVDDVQAEIGRGNYTQAQSMMQEVVAAKPGSARAHYLYAEILAHNKRFADAAAQAALARQADPAIRFTDAAKFSAFEQLLQREQRAAANPSLSLGSPAVSPPTALPAPRPAAVPASSGTPGWVWMLALAAAAAAFWAWSSRRRAAVGASSAVAAYPGASAGYPGAAGAMPAPGYGPPGGPGYAAPYGPGYGGPATRPGSGMLGVGLAAAGGVAAGMLAEKMLSGGHHGSDAGLPAAAGAGAGGLVPGLFDADPAAAELESRPIDFGSGDGWGGGDAAPPSSDDGGW